MPNLIRTATKATRRRASSAMLDPLGGVQAIKGWLSSSLRDEEIERRLNQLPTKNLNEYGYDPFGYNPKVLKSVAPIVNWLYRYYFRTQVYGIENVPKSGRCLLIANHSGQLPIDGIIIGSSILFDADPPRMPRAMVERFVPRLPWVSTFFSRCGQILGAPENCVRLLEADEMVLVFPEGARGISKPPSKAYQLTEFGYGFMRLAIRTGTPIVPIAVVGAEEQYIRIGNIKPLARMLNIPAFPLFLFGGAPIPGGVLPLPVRYHIHFGQPLTFEGDPDEDDAIIGRKVKKVKSAIQNMLHKGLADRQSVF